MEQKHQMLIEIEEQVGIANMFLRREHDEELRKIVETIESTLNRDGEVIIVGSGSSYHSSVFGSYLFSTKAHFVAPAFLSGEFGSYISSLDRKSLVITVSQSGDNPDLLELLRDILNSGAEIVTLTNDPESPIAERSHYIFPLHVGVERAVPATKTYLSELLTFGLLAEGISDGSEMFRYQDQIVGGIHKIIQAEYRSNVQKIVKNLVNASNIYVLAEGLEYANAKELALKIKECSQIEAEAFSVSEFMHGPITLIKKISESGLYFRDASRRS